VQRLLSRMAVTALFVGGSSATTWATAGDLVFACLKKDGKVAEMSVGTAPTCKKNETLVQWNQTGQQGQDGAKGNTGPTFLTGHTRGMASGQNNCGPVSGLGDAIIPSGFDCTQVSMLSPSYAVSVTRMTVIPTSGFAGSYDAYILVNGHLTLSCYVTTTAGCTASPPPISVPANSTLAIFYTTSSNGDAITTVELQ
jgi:hypothetical protein